MPPGERQPGERFRDEGPLCSDWGQEERPPEIDGERAVASKGRAEAVPNAAGAERGNNERDARRTPL